jgi:hypothetical protein
VIAGLVGFAASLAVGATRDHLFDRISSLDSIADVIKQALDAFSGSANADRGGDADVSGKPTMPILLIPQTYA